MRTESGNMFHLAEWYSVLRGTDGSTLIYRKVIFGIKRVYEPLG